MSTDKFMVKTREKGSLLTQHSSNYDTQTNHEIVKHTRQPEAPSRKKLAGFTCSMPSARNTQAPAEKLAVVRIDPNKGE